MTTDTLPNDQLLLDIADKLRPEATDQVEEARKHGDTPRSRSPRGLRFLHTRGPVDRHYSTASNHHRL